MARARGAAGNLAAEVWCSRPRAVGAGEGVLLAPSCLICRVDARGCAVPIEHVREVMRPCAVQRLASAPPWVLGVGVIRGDTVPVVDAGILLAGEACMASRFVVLRAGSRRVALAVAGVLGIRPLAEGVRSLPPLLAAGSGLVASLALMDGELHEVLEGSRLVELASEALSGAATP